MRFGCTPIKRIAQISWKIRIPTVSFPDNVLNSALSCNNFITIRVELKDNAIQRYNLSNSSLPIGKGTTERIP